MKKMSLLLSMLAAVSFGATDICAADIKAEPSTQTLERVYVDVNEIFQKSSAGIDLARWSAQKNGELGALLSTKQAKLSELEKEIRSGILPEETVQQKTASLEIAKRQAELDVQSAKLGMESQLNAKMKSVEKDIRNTIKTVANEEKWLEVLSKDDTRALFFSEQLDVTEKVLEAFNKNTRADAAKSMLRGDSAKAPEFLKA